MSIPSHVWSDGLTALVIPDVHYPVHDYRAVDLVAQVAAAKKFDLVIQLGDFLDLDALGRWTAGNARNVEGERFVADAALGAEFLKKLMKSVRRRVPSAPLIMLEGNHEQRVERLLDGTPYLEGLFDIPRLLDFDEIGNASFIRVSSEHSLYRLDWCGGKIKSRVLTRRDWVHGLGVAFIHGWYCNIHSAKKHAETYGRGPIVYGHVHAVQQHTLASFGRPAPSATSLGHLRIADPSWIAGPIAWQHAFGILHMDTTPGDYDLQVVRINADERGTYRCHVDGKGYETR